MTLQLPASLPLGRATLIVQIDEPDSDTDASLDTDFDPDHDDIEWWEEFEGQDGAPPVEDADEAAESSEPPPGSD